MADGPDQNTVELEEKAADGGDGGGGGNALESAVDKIGEEVDKTADTVIEDAFEVQVEEIGSFLERDWVVKVKITVLFFLIPLLDTLTDIAFSISLFANACFVDNFGGETLYLVAGLSTFGTVSGLIGTAYMFNKYRTTYADFRKDAASGAEARRKWFKNLDEISSLKLKYGWFQWSELGISLLEDSTQFAAAVLQSYLLNSTTPFSAASQLVSSVSIAKIWSLQLAHASTATDGCVARPRRRKNCKKVLSMVYGVLFLGFFIPFMILFNFLNINHLLFVETGTLTATVSGTLADGSAWTDSFSTNERAVLRDDSTIFFDSTGARDAALLSPSDSSYGDTAWSDVRLRFAIGESQSVAFALDFAGDGAEWSGAALAGLPAEPCGAAQAERPCRDTVVVDDGDKKTLSASRQEVSDSPYCAAFTACDAGEDDASCAHVERVWQGNIVASNATVTDDECAAPRPVSLSLAYNTIDAVFTCGIFSRRF